MCLELKGNSQIFIMVGCFKISSKIIKVSFNSLEIRTKLNWLRSKPFLFYNYN